MQENLNKEHLKITDEMLDAMLATNTIEPPSNALFERIISCAPQPSIWQQLYVWFGNRAISVGLASVMAGVFCFAIFTTQWLPDNTTYSTDIFDYGQDWLG